MPEQPSTNREEFHLEYLKVGPGDAAVVMGAILVVIASFVTFAYCLVSGIGDILRSLCCC